MTLLNLVGMRFRPPADRIVPLLKTGDRVILVREPENPHDPNAVAVYLHLGYITSKQAQSLGPEIDKAKLQMADPFAGIMTAAESDAFHCGVLVASQGRIEGKLIQTLSGHPCIDIEENIP